MPKREIYVKEIVNDIRSGMDHSQLMRKYKLTLKGLDSAFKKLLAGGFLLEQELNSGKLDYEETVDLSGMFPIVERRSKPRKQYFYSGTIDHVDILDHIQWIVLDGRQTILEITVPDGKRCKVYLRAGEIIHAINGERYGEEAIYSTVMSITGSFCHLPWTEPDRRTIEKPALQILLEAARRRDEDSGGPFR
jgi:hypothetical protein